MTTISLPRGELRCRMVCCKWRAENRRFASRYWAKAIKRQKTIQPSTPKQVGGSSKGPAVCRLQATTDFQTSSNVGLLLLSVGEQSVVPVSSPSRMRSSSRFEKTGHRLCTKSWTALRCTKLMLSVSKIAKRREANSKSCRLKCNSRVRAVTSSTSSSGEIIISMTYEETLESSSTRHRAPLWGVTAEASTILELRRKDESGCFDVFLGRRSIEDREVSPQ